MAALSRHEQPWPSSPRCSLANKSLSSTVIANLVADKLGVNKLVLKVASWVASAMLRRVELWDDNVVIPPALAARAAVLAFGDELIDLEQMPNESDSQWLSPG
jgi:hypothetical protein